MNINRKSILFLFLFLFQQIISTDLSSNLENEIFFLVIKDENEQLKAASFSLIKLQKCGYLIGAPLRSNSFPTTKYFDIDSMILKRVEDQATKLQSICVVSDENNCCFETRENKDLVYVFNLSKTIKEAKGFIINEKKLQDIILYKNEGAQKINEDNESSNIIDIEDLIKDAKPLEEKSKFKIYCEWIVIKAIAKFFQIKDSYDSFTKKIKDYFSGQKNNDDKIQS